jgi:hypothetical protein
VYEVAERDGALSIAGDVLISRKLARSAMELGGHRIPEPANPRR